MNRRREKWQSQALKSWERTLQFWLRAVHIYSSYKICQARVRFVMDDKHRDRIWERQHEVSAEKVYSLCCDLGGFFLKAAQIIAKPDLAPDAWVKKLITLCDSAPATPFEEVQLVLNNEFEKNLCEIFERFDEVPIGSASIAQVHRARIKCATSDVAVKVQHPGVQDLMMTDIRNLKAFAKYLQRTDIKFDLVSVVQEIEEQVNYEFDFTREADSMERIHEFFKTCYKAKPPVLVPKPIAGMVTRKVLVMEFLEGTSIMHLGDEISSRGICPHGKFALAFKKNILKKLSTAYGQMILKSGFFHADPHPGNILVNKESKVALLDYGQVKKLPDVLRLKFARLIIALVCKDAEKIGNCFKDIGIITSTKASDSPHAFLNLAQMLFDTRLPSGVKKATPFGEESSLRAVPVQSFPEELFFVLRTVQLLRGLSVGMGIDYSCAEDWKCWAEQALLESADTKHKTMGIMLARCHRRSRVSRRHFRRRNHLK